MGCRIRLHGTKRSYLTKTNNKSKAKVSYNFTSKAQNACREVCSTRASLGRMERILPLDHDNLVLPIFAILLEHSPV